MNKTCMFVQKSAKITEDSAYKISLPYLLQIFGTDQGLQ